LLKPVRAVRRRWLKVCVLAVEIPGQCPFLSSFAFLLRPLGAAFLSVCQPVFPVLNRVFHIDFLGIREFSTFSTIFSVEFTDRVVE
jgi:hypothetical protein